MLHKKNSPNLSEWGFWICFSGGTYASNDAKFSLALIISMFGYFCGLFDCTMTMNKKSTNNDSLMHSNAPVLALPMIEKSFCVELHEEQFK